MGDRRSFRASYAAVRNQRDCLPKGSSGLAAGLIPIVCIGETEAEMLEDRTLEVLTEQMLHSLPSDVSQGEFVAAYEPVWAIGTGKMPTIDQISDVHLFIRSWLDTQFGDNGQRARVLYGGSVKPESAKDILSCDHVDGALVGGASLKAVSFLAIVEAI